MSDEWGLESIFHFTVNATDFERSLDFYTTLGFRVLRDNRDVVWPPMVARNFGMPEAQGRGAPVGDVPSGEGECDAQERGAPVGNVPSGEGECETHG